MKTILLVDDSLTTRLILTEMANNIDINEPINVKDFSNAKDALAWIEFNDVHLIIVDYMMDEISGYEMLKIIRANKKFDHIPLIAISTDTDKSVKYRFLEDGATDFLLKPIDYYECMLRCRNLLKQT